MQTMEESDVVIVGAGPAGSTTARWIASFGFNVLLIEKDEFPGETNVCAGGIERWVADELKIDNPIEKNIIGNRWNFPWGVEEFFGGEYSAATVDRSVFDNALAVEAEIAGAKLLTCTLVRDISKTDREFLVKIEDKQEKISEVKTKLVIFADGPNTLAQRIFGIGFEVLPENTMISAMLEVEWKDNPIDYFGFFAGREISPWGYGWVFPKKDTVNIGICCLYSQLRHKIHDYLNAFLKNTDTEGREILRFTSALIPVAPAERIFGESVLVVGDAAGMVDPLYGGGISQSIHGGRIAGKVAVSALDANDLSEKFLSQYQAEWRKTDDFDQINKAYHLSTIFLYLSNIDKNAFAKLMRYRLDKNSISKKVLLYPWMKS